MLPHDPPPASSAPPPARWRRRVVLAALAATALYVALAIAADTRELGAVLGGFPPWRFAAALGLAFLAYAVRSVRWHLYLRRLGVYAPEAEPALGATAGFTMGLASGKLGQVVKAYYLNVAAGTPYSRSVPAVFAERVADVASLLLLLLLGIALAPGLGAGPLLALAAALALSWAALRSRRAARGLVRALAPIGWVRRHAAGILAGHAQLRGHVALRRLGAPALVGLAAFLLEALALWTLAAGLGIPLGFGRCVLILALVDVAGMASLIPGGLGAAEGSMMVLLGLDGVAPAPATALTLLFRISTLWLGVALSTAAAGLLHAAHPERRDRPTQG